MQLTDKMDIIGEAQKALSLLKQDGQRRFGLYELMHSDGDFIFDLYTKKLINAKKRYDLDSMVLVSRRGGTGILPLTKPLEESAGLQAYGFIADDSVRERMPLPLPANSVVALLHDYNALFDQVFKVFELKDGAYIPYVLGFYKHDKESSNEFRKRGGL
jgi:hypothetical protein